MSRSRLVSADRRIWSALLSAIILLSGLGGASAGAGPDVFAAPVLTESAPATSGGGDREVRDEAPENGDRDSACSRLSVRKLSRCAGLKVKTPRPTARVTASVARVSARSAERSVSEHHAQVVHGSRSPGARLLLALGISRT